MYLPYLSFSPFSTSRSALVLLNLKSFLFGLLLELLSVHPFCSNFINMAEDNVTSKDLEEKCKITSAEGTIAKDVTEVSSNVFFFYFLEHDIHEYHFTGLQLCS